MALVRGRTHHMLLSTWGRRWRQVNLAAFTVYLDDSGTSPSQRVAIATAMIIPAYQIIRLENEWAKLTEKEKFSDFHTSEFAARNPKTVFGKWDDTKRNRVFRRVREITKKYGTIVYSFAVNKKDYDELVPKEFRQHIGEYHYTWAVRHIIKFLDEWRFSRPDTPPPFEYVFDWMGKPTDERRMEVDTVMDQRESWANGNENRVGDYIHYGFRRREELPALQCADVLAWTCYRYALFAFHKTPPQPFAEVAWNDFSEHQGQYNWLKAITVRREHLQKWVDKEMKDGSALRNFAEWKKKADEEKV